MVAEAAAAMATTPHAQQQQQHEAEAAVMAEVQQAYARVAERYRGTDDSHVPFTLTHIMRNEGTGVIYNDINRELVARHARVAMLPAAAPSASPLYKRVLSWHAALRRRGHNPYYDNFFATDDVELRLWVEGLLEYYREKLTHALQCAGVSPVPRPPQQPPSDEAMAAKRQQTTADDDDGKDKDSSGGGKKSGSKAKKKKKKAASTATRGKRPAAAADTAVNTTATTTTAQQLTPATLHELFARAAARVTVDACRSAAFAEAVDLTTNLMHTLRVANALALLFVEDAAVVADDRHDELFYMLHEYMGSTVWIEHYVVLLIGTVCVHGRRVVQHLQQQQQQQQQQAAHEVAAAAASAPDEGGSGGAADAVLRSTVRDLYGLIEYCATFYGENTNNSVLQLLVLQCARYVGVLAFPPRSLVALVHERHSSSSSSNNNSRNGNAAAAGAAAVVAADDGNTTTSNNATATTPLVWTVAQWHADALVRYVTHDALYFARSMASFLVSDEVRHEALMSVLLQQLLCFDMHGVRGGAAAAAGAFANDNNDNDDEEEEQQRQAAAARVAAAATTRSNARRKRSAADEDDNNEGDEEYDDEEEEDEEEEEEDDEEHENEEQPRGEGSNTAAAAPPSSPQLTIKLSIDAPVVLTQCCTRVQQQQQPPRQQRCSCFLGAALRVLLEQVASQLLSAHPSNVVHSATAAAAASVSGDDGSSSSRGSGDQDTKISTTARLTPTAAATATTAAPAAKSGGARVIANSATAVADARAALLSLARCMKALVLPAQVQQPLWTSLSLAAQDTVAVPFATTHFVAQMRSAMHACMLQLLRCVTATTTAKAATTSVTEDVLLPFYAHLIHCEHIYYNLTYPVSTASSDAGDVTASATKSAEASKSTPAAAAAATGKSAQQHEPPTTPPPQPLHSIFYTAVAQALRACYPDNAGRALIVPIVNSMHTFLMQQEDDNNNSSSSNTTTSTKAAATAATAAAAVRVATVPGVVALSSVDELASVARLVLCVAERDTFLRKYTDVCQRRLLARHAPSRNADDIADAEARKRQWEQRACALLQTTLGDGVELRQLSELCASLQSTAMTMTPAAAASTAAVPAAQKKAKGRGAAAAAAAVSGDAATAAAASTALTLRVTVLNWKLWGYQHAAHMSSDVRERGVQQLTGHTLAPTATTPLPFPSELHAAMQQYERTYAASHTGKQLHWRRAADCYSSFSLAFPKDQGKLTTVHGSLLLHQLYLAIAQYRRAGVSYAVLAARAGDMRVDALAQMLQRHVVKFGLLVKLPPAISNDNNGSSNNNNNNTAASCATTGGVHPDERVALNYEYTSPSSTRGVDFVHYPPRISRVSPLDEKEMQRVHMERRNKIQVAVIQTMKSAHEMAHAELFAQTRSKLQHSVELHRDVFKLVLDQLMERGYLERANTDAAATVYRYRA